MSTLCVPGCPGGTYIAAPPTPFSKMRSFILALALALPLSLTACGNDTAEPGDMEDVIGDGEIIDEPGEIEPDDPDDTVMEDAIID